MRSMFWLGCAVLVCAASFVYLAADFSGRHPDSLAIRCARATQTVTVACNPVTALTAASVHAVQTVRELMGKTLLAAKETAQCGGCPHAPACRQTQARPPMEVIDLSLVSEPSSPTEGGQEEAELSMPVPVPTAEEPANPTETPAANAEDKDVPSTMPPAKEDGDESEDSAPAEMPYPQPNDDQEPMPPPMEDLVREQLDVARQQVFELWFDLFQKSGENGSDAEPPAVTAAEAEEIPAPGAQEEAETMAPEPTADCPVDPNYHHQYSGCPYMGSGSHCPPPTPDSVPARHRRKKMKASPIVDPKPDVEESEAPASDGGVPFPMDRQPKTSRPENLGPTPDDETSHHPEVDTMEFRKSDAKEGEFDSPPF